MTIKHISSRNNAQFKVFLKLAKARGIKQYGMSLMSGPKQITEVLTEFPEKCAGIIFSGPKENPLGPLAAGLPQYHLSPNLFKDIDSFGTGAPVLLIHADPFARLKQEGAAQLHGCTLCIPFQDPANVGAVIRSAAAFGVPRVVMLAEAAHPFHPKAIRAAGSNIFRVSFYKGPSLNSLKKTQVPMITLSPDGTDVDNFVFPPRFFLIPGMEGQGLPGHLKQRPALAIPMAKGVESLNAALATGIVLYTWHRKRKRK